MLPYQMSLAGKTFCGIGADVQLTSITGLRDMPPLRSGNVARGGQDGNFPGYNLLDAKAIVITFNISVTSGVNGPEYALQQLSTAFNNIPDPSTVALTPGQYLTGYVGGPANPTSVLLIQLPNRQYPLACFGRATKYALPVDLDYNFNHYAPTAEFTIDNGAVYDWHVISGSCGLPTPSVGLPFPVTFPATFGSSAGGVITLNNSGNYQTWPVIKFTGPCNTPVATLNSTGAYIGVNLALAAGDVLIIDTYAGTILLDGTGLRNNHIMPGSTFFALPSGSSSIGFGTNDALAVAGQMQVAILPAYAAV